MAKCSKGAPSHTGASQWELFARCASGFEKILAHELKSLGMQRVRPLQGGVSFFGDTHSAYTACLWSRVATRIQLVLARVSAKDADALYAGAERFAWEDHVPASATIAVEAHGTNSSLRNTKFSALKVKDAICDRLRKKRGGRPDVDAKHPDFTVNVAIHQQRATLYLNLSGESLHRRGYRQEGMQSEAPLKETLAAGMLLAAKWPSMANDNSPFADPMCGSGTLAIEAALIASNTAPGILRDRWGFLGWSHHDTSIWQAVLSAANDVRLRHVGRPRIVAGDLNEDVVRLARANARRAGVEDWIRFDVDDASNLERRLRGSWASVPGLLATNPPYGIRLLSPSSLRQAYSSLADAVSSLPKGWNVAIITPDAGIDSSLGRLPTSKISCFNGPIPACIRLYDTHTPRLEHQVTSLLGKQRRIPLAEKNSVQFASRLRKVAKERTRWAHAEDIDCYRIYDADLPEYAFSLDMYGTKVLIEEHRRPRAADPERAARRLADATSLTAALLDVEPDDIVVHAWSDDRNAKGSRRDQASHVWVQVHEGDLRFNVDLMHPSDGLSPSRRSLRQYVAEAAQGQRVAALFAPAATMLASAGRAGATSLAFADASQKGIDRVRDLLSDNSLKSDRCKLSCVDPRSWVRQQNKMRCTYDLVVCTPPEWLPAEASGGNEWDLSRDHVSLIVEAARLLSHDGRILFVCANPNVELRVGDLSPHELEVEDISASMIPPDFVRTRDRIRAYIIRARS